MARNIKSGLGLRKRKHTKIPKSFLRRNTKPRKHVHRRIKGKVRQLMGPTKRSRMRSNITFG